jgi:hypothetical protein
VAAPFWIQTGLPLVLPAGSDQLELRNYAAGGANILGSATGITAGSWHHFAIVRNGITRFNAIETHTDLSANGPWPEVPGHSRIGGGDQTVTLPISFGEVRRFFRLRVWLE